MTFWFKKTAALHTLRIWIDVWGGGQQDVTLWEETGISTDW